MNWEELDKEVERLGKTMEKPGPLSKEDKERAKACFTYVANLPEISEDDKLMLQTALRVLRYL